MPSTPRMNTIDALPLQSRRNTPPASAQEGPCPPGHKGEAWLAAQAFSLSLSPRPMALPGSAADFLCGLGDVTPLPGLGTVTSGQGGRMEVVQLSPAS